MEGKIHLHPRRRDVSLPPTMDYRAPPQEMGGALLLQSIQACGASALLAQS